MAKCDEEGCVEESPDVLTEWMWDMVGEKAYCPMHGPAQVRKVRKEAQMEAINRRANEIEAKRSFDTGWYRAWDEFQSDIANFHRANGRPAHKDIRTMTPHDFRKRYAREGRIDIANATWAIETAERAFTAKTNERYKGI